MNGGKEFTGKLVGFDDYVSKFAACYSVAYFNES
jgi:hypothetical protein